MFWRISRFRAGQLVQVRSKEEILATLDEQGCIDGMPFMPEMLSYCGQLVQVSAVAHKTCETARQTWQGRRLNETVHLSGLRCDGSAHGGCQAACNLYWKDAWLKPAREKEATPPGDGSIKSEGKCEDERLYATTRRDDGAGVDEPCFSCQATKITDASEPLRWWDPRQYVLDVVTGNHSIRHVVRVLWLASLRHWLRITPRGYRIVKRFREAMHRWLTGRDIPDFEGTIPAGQPTPTGRLDLREGERVRVKSQNDIIATLNKRGRNRGLSYGEELSMYCGGVYTVQRSVTRIIDELTGKMMTMKEPCVTLHGVVCTSQYSECRLMCPRAITPYWREIWLERVEENGGPNGAAKMDGVAEADVSD